MQRQSRSATETRSVQFLCLLGASCLFAGILVDLGGGTAKALMVAAVVLFVPGAFITFALVRRLAGPPN